MKQIKKICASNLKLIDFLYVDLVEQDVDFFRALDSVVTYRLSQLKKDGLSRNVNEYDMEDIILSSSISLKSFGSQEIASITHKETNTVRESLYLAQKQVLLKRNYLPLVPVTLYANASCPLILSRRLQLLDFLLFIAFFCARHRTLS